MVADRYYVFGFLMLSLVILLVTCAEISVVMCYFQLCSENHKWWWRAFLTSGSSALYLYLYSALYFYTNVSGAVAARCWCRCTNFTVARAAERHKLHCLADVLRLHGHGISGVLPSDR